MLTQLPNGAWIDLREVREVYALPSDVCEMTGAEFSDRTVIQTASGGSWCIPFPDLTSAEAYRDEIAAKVNEARGGLNMPKIFERAAPLPKMENSVIRQLWDEKVHRGED